MVQNGTRCLLPTLHRVGAVGLLTLLTLSTASEATPTGGNRPPLAFAGAPLETQRAARIAGAGGFELIDFHPCTGGSEGCALLAVRQPDGKSFVYQVSDKRCTPGDAPCLGGFTVSRLFGGPPGKPPSDPRHEAQVNATNEIIEALGDGQYDGKYDQFWEDLESIRTWTNPPWIEPGPSPRREDPVSMTGRFGDVNPAVPISGRYKNGDGRKECRPWVSYTSTAAAIDHIGNWIGNAIGDGGDSEVAVFSENGAAQLVKPERRWSNGTDPLDFSVGARVKVPTSVWVIYADTDYAGEKAELERECELANAILAGSRCGIEPGPVAYYDKTSAPADPDQELSCASIEPTFEQRVGFHQDRMNVYIVKALVADDRAGVAWTAESDSVIVLDRGRSDTALVHEYGHWFDLWHTNTKDMPLVNVRNVMSQDGEDGRNVLTAGQYYRANFSRDSYINRQGLRDGKKKDCRHLQGSDNQCPGLENEF